MTDLGTPGELRPLAEQVLVWVQRERSWKSPEDVLMPSEDDIRRIELMALAVREWSMFLTLYGLNQKESHA